MNKAFIKWSLLCAVGLGALVFTALCFIRKDYTWVFATGFTGVFLVSSSLKRIRFLKNAAKALEAGKGEVIIFYRDKNLKESQNAVIPAGEDTFWFYGYLPEKKDIKMFRWERIQRALANEKELKKEDILEYLAGTSKES